MTPQRRRVLAAAAIAACALLGTPTLLDRVGGTPQRVLDRIRFQPRLLWQDLLPTRGYYEDLDDTMRFSLELSRAYRRTPPGWQGSLVFSRLFEPTYDVTLWRPLPGSSIRDSGVTIGLNWQGMRDQSRAIAKPDGTVRIAWLGDSQSFGRAVPDDEMFQSRVERALSARHPLELLNFARDGGSALHEMLDLQERALRFAPDAVVIGGHAGDRMRLVQALTWALVRGAAWPQGVEELRQLLARAGLPIGVRAPGSWFELSNRLRQQVEALADELLLTAYRGIVSECRARNIIPVYVVLPLATRELYGSVADARRRATAAGFVVVDISDAFEGTDLEELWIAPYDDHPNRRAHALIAERLEKALLEAPELGPRLR